MRRRIAFCVLIALAVTVSAFSAAGPVTCRLERAKRTDAGEEGLLRPELDSETKTDQVVWSTSIMGRRVKFYLPLPVESILISMKIVLDEQEPVVLLGNMSFDNDRQIISFTPIKNIFSTKDLLYLRLERYRYLKKENTTDSERDKWDNSPFYSPDVSDLYIDYIDSKPFVTGWDLLIGNAEIFTGEFEFRRGSIGTLRLIDSDMNGVFGDFAGTSGGDLLAWEYTTRNLLGQEKIVRGSTPLASMVRIDNTRYEIHLEWSGPDGVMLVLKSPRS